MSVFSKKDKRDNRNEIEIKVEIRVSNRERARRVLPLRPMLSIQEYVRYIDTMLLKT